MATYAIGDVQGCFDALRRLLDRIHFDAASDRLWFVGDLVNRGPDSLAVLRFVRGLGAAAMVVCGNHDLHLAMLAEGVGKYHADETLGPVLAAPDRDELMAWLRARPLCHAEGGFVLVHAGLLPGWTVARAAALSEEVRQALIGPDYREFLVHMRGGQPDEWSDALTGWDRLRVIVNAMTRMRFCTPGGRMEFRAKGPPEAAPAGFMPWFAVPGRASADHVVVCGHWSALGVQIQDGLMALDSGCVWGGPLTAVRLEDRAVFQVPGTRATQPHGWD